MSTSLFGLASSDLQANTTIQSLKQAGFRIEDISVFYPDKNDTDELPSNDDTNAPEKAIAGGATGGVIGGALGWMVGIGMMAIPGVGPFIAAGPIMAALSGAVIGAAVGSLTGVLIGLGMTEFDAKKYESKIRNGAILLVVHGESRALAGRARQIFQAAGIDDIGSSGEAGTTLSSPTDEKVDQAKVATEKNRRQGTDAR